MHAYPEKKIGWPCLKKWIDLVFVGVLQYLFGHADDAKFDIN